MYINWKLNTPKPQNFNFNSNLFFEHTPYGKEAWNKLALKGVQFSEAKESMEHSLE